MKRNNFETTEHVAKNFTTTAKIILERFGRAKTHELIDSLADEKKHRAEWDDDGGEIVEDPMTIVERDFGETEKDIIQALTEKETIIGGDY